MNSEGGFVIYSKKPCPYCDAAKRLLISRNIPFAEIDLTDQDDLIQQTKEKYGHSTVPIILRDGQLIGGYDELAGLDRSGSLQTPRERRQ